MDKDLQLIEGETKEEKGASLLEYALLAALVAVVCITAMTFLGEQASISFSQSGSTVHNA